MNENDQIGVVDLTIQNDVAGELALDGAKIQTLEYIADHGGEVGWDWNAVKPATREMVADLIVEGLLTEREYVTHALQVSGKLTLRLTDKGRNVVALHRKRRVIVSEMKPVVAAIDD